MGGEREVERETDRHTDTHTPPLSLRRQEAEAAERAKLKSITSTLGESDVQCLYDRNLRLLEEQQKQRVSLCCGYRYCCCCCSSSSPSSSSSRRCFNCRSCCSLEFFYELYV